MHNKISIIVPVFKGISHLKEFIESLEKFEKEPDEIIFVLSPSKEIDEIQSLIEKSPLNIKKLISKERLYPGAARNYGAERAKFEWIAFLDITTIPSQVWFKEISDRISSELNLITCKTIAEGRSFFQDIIKLATYGDKPFRSIPGSCVNKSFFLKNKFSENIRAGEDIKWFEDNKLHINEHKISKTLISYHGFPKKIKSAIKKWFKYSLENAKSEILREEKFLYLTIFLIVFAYFIYNWNFLFAGKEWEESEYFIPHINKIIWGLVFSVYFIFRGIIKPKLVSVSLRKILPFKWIGISLIGILIDFVKMPGRIIGSLSFVQNISPNQSKKILFLSPYPNGCAAGQRFKFENAIEILERNEYIVDQNAFLDVDSWNVLYSRGFYIIKFKGLIKGYMQRLLILLKLREYDYVYLYLWGTPRGLPIYEFLIRLLSKRIIVDIDDEVYKKQSILISIFTSNLKTNYLTKYADTVLHTSEYSSSECKKINLKGSSYFIPCNLDMNRYIKKEFANLNDRKIVLGWTGTFSSKEYLDSIRNALITLDKIVDFKLILITNFDYEIPLKDYELKRWKESSEIKDLNCFDIGLYPILFDDWGLSKGGLKVQQYMSLGIPSVCTNHGAAKSFIKNNETGFLVNSESDWVEKLKHLILNPDLIKEMGLKSRIYAEKNFSKENISMKYIQAFKEL